MKNTVKFLPTELIDQIAALRVFSAKDLALPNSECVTMEFSLNGTTLYTGTSESRAKTVIPDLKHKVEMVFTVDVVKFFSLLKLFPAGGLITASLDSGSDMVELKTPTSTYHLRNHPRLDLIEASETKLQCTIATNELATRLATTIPFVSTNSGKQPSFKAVHLAHEGHNFYIEASDGNALIQNIIKLPDAAEEGHIALPARSAHALAQFLKSSDAGSTELRFSHDRVDITAGDTVIQTTPVNAARLPLERLISNKPEQYAVADVESLANSISTLDQLLNGDLRPAVTITIGAESSITTAAKSDQDGMFPLEVQHGYTEDRPIIVNPKLLRPLLNAVKEKEIGLAISLSPSEPMWVTTQDRSVIGALAGIKI